MEQVGSVHPHSPRECDALPIRIVPRRIADPDPRTGAYKRSYIPRYVGCLFAMCLQKHITNKHLCPRKSCSMSFGALPTSDLFSCPFLTLLA